MKRKSITKIKQSHLPKENFKLKSSIFIISDNLSKMGALWEDSDKSGKIARDLLINGSCVLDRFEVLSDDIDKILNAVREETSRNTDVIITIGGTGISKRDVTIEALESFFDKILPGFGELFRFETYKELGTTSIMSRAFAGTKNESIIVCLPGSPNAVKLGLNLIMPEFQHLKNLLKRKI